jgi:hypothetical protein
LPNEILSTIVEEEAFTGIGMHGVTIAELRHEFIYCEIVIIIIQAEDISTDGLAKLQGLFIIAI